MRRALIITRDPETAELLRLQFELMDLDVAHAYSAGAAREKLEKRIPDVCVVDVLGATAQELDAVQALLTTCDNMRCLAITLVPALPAAAQWPIVHAHHIIKKPYDLIYLMRTVKTLMDRRST